MKPAWHGLSPRCLAVALCLMACIGCSEPSDYSAETSEVVASTPVLIFSTPQTEPSFSQEDPQAFATSPETAATVDPLSGVRTPVLVFFTPTTDQADQQKFQSDAGTPGIPPVSGAGSPASQLTRVALPLPPSISVMPRPTGIAVTPRSTVSSPAPQTSDELPFARWPKGWWLAAVAVLAIIFVAWLFAGRRS